MIRVVLNLALEHGHFLVHTANCIRPKSLSCQLDNRVPIGKIKMSLWLILLLYRFPLNLSTWRPDYTSRNDPTDRAALVRRDEMSRVEMSTWRNLPRGLLSQFGGKAKSLSMWQVGACTVKNVGSQLCFQLYRAITREKCHYFIPSNTPVFPEVDFLISRNPFKNLGGEGG